LQSLWCWLPLNLAESDRVTLLRFPMPRHQQPSTSNGHSQGTAAGGP
jgi:hypothetical protein